MNLDRVSKWAIICGTALALVMSGAGMADVFGTNGQRLTAVEGKVNSMTTDHDRLVRVESKLDGLSDQMSLNLSWMKSNLRLSVTP